MFRTLSARTEFNVTVGNWKFLMDFCWMSLNAISGSTIDNALPQSGWSNRRLRAIAISTTNVNTVGRTRFNYIPVGIISPCYHLMNELKTYRMTINKFKVRLSRCISNYSQWFSQAILLFFYHQFSIK